MVVSCRPDRPESNEKKCTEEISEKMIRYKLTVIFHSCCQFVDRQRDKIFVLTSWRYHKNPKNRKTRHSIYLKNHHIIPEMKNNELGDAVARLQLNISEGISACWGSEKWSDPIAKLSIDSKFDCFLSSVVTGSLN